MKKLKEEFKDKKKGITLISLVVTIIVLLIFAGVSIGTLIGENGILNKATEGKKQTQIGDEKEGIILATTIAQMSNNGYQELNQSNLQNAINNQFGVGKASVIENKDGTFTVSFIDSKIDYNITSSGVEIDINWNEKMANAVAPESQDEERNNGVIGIGTDGNPVDMDLWEYYLLEDNTFVLNDSATSNNAGYVGQIANERGMIYGTIPQYISMDHGKIYHPVTSLYNTFREVSDLKIAPKIPTTVINMICTFSQTNISISPNIPPSVKNLAWCFELTNLEETPMLPEGVLNIDGTFSSCSKLTTLNPLPNSIEIMYSTFSNCTNLKIIPNNFYIPKNTTNINQLFWKCSNLTTIPSNFIISAKVDNIAQTFADCTNLEGSIIIDITPSIYMNCFQNLEKDPKLVVNYTQNCSNIDRILNYNNALKGELVII